MLITAWLIAAPATSVGYAFAGCTLPKLLAAWLNATPATSVGLTSATCLLTQLLAAWLTTVLAATVGSSFATFTVYYFLVGPLEVTAGWPLQYTHLSNCAVYEFLAYVWPLCIHNFYCIFHIFPSAF